MELIEQIDAHLTDDARALLDDLFTTLDDQNRYRLTLLKKLSQSTKPLRTKEAVVDYKTLAALHGQLRGTLEILDLGVAGIRYYAGSVLRSEMFQLQRRAAVDRYIHAAAFIAHQFYRTQDNLIDLWLSVMASFQAKAVREHNERLLESRAAQHERLKTVVDHFKNSNGAVGPGAPTDFLDAHERAALTRTDGTFRTSLYKVFLFQHVAAAIKSGDLNLSQSYKYRPMDAYLIALERWRRERPELLESAGLTGFADPETVLAILQDALTRQYELTNANAATNPYLKVRSDGVFHIATLAAGSDDASPTSELFLQRHDLPLAQALETINNHCGMLGAFEHWQQTYIRQTASRTALLAGIMGLGCGIGVRKIAWISSQVTERELEYAVNWRFSLDDIRAANDAVVKAMDEMELPNIYRDKADTLHTASDGQKFEVRGESLAASRSFKYFGQGQGVSAYTFIDECHILWHSLMISAADWESAFVIDGLMCNDVVRSDIHSTDSHGYTEANFGMTHLLGFSFAPRIKGIGKQTLYTFKLDRPGPQDWIIAPDKTINETLIRENWDVLLCLVATIKLKENTASDIFRRLNSYSRQHALYLTLKAGVRPCGWTVDV